MDIMDIEQLYWQFDAAHHGTGEYTGMARSERDAFKLVVAYALAEKNREIESIKRAYKEEIARHKDAIHQLIVQQAMDSGNYHALMKQVVEFAENTIYIMGALCSNRPELESNGHVIRSRQFLSSPEVQAWREQEGGHEK